MEIRVIRSENDLMEIEIKGEDHTLVNFLREALWKVKGVKDAGYNIKHPLVSEPRILVRTDGIKPKKAFEQAISLMKADLKDLKSLAKALA